MFIAFFCCCCCWRFCCSLKRSKRIEWKRSTIVNKMKWELHKQSANCFAFARFPSLLFPSFEKHMSTPTPRIFSASVVHHSVWPQVSDRNMTTQMVGVATTVFARKKWSCQPGRISTRVSCRKDGNLLDDSNRLICSSWWSCMVIVLVVWGAKK